ncbi:MAG: bifunctional 3-deoxy-7-phosphoheptulonate synthase/chorismate mutase type II [Bacteroidia bacterium]|nr:bifunctional 3-deoxy-7-phosphoheptulonate synthase/chorismate mutase type II [Bacteroidia bacterium]
MEMEFKPLYGETQKRPFIIAGPCSAESEEQILETAHALSKQDVDLFRAGIWKPRTRPNSFEGVGVIGLKWLKKVKEETGLKTTTEVAKANHVYEALKYGIDAVWIGARTTVNPFAVQEIADALEGIDIPVLIKNPINPDLNLWIGAIERVYKAGIRRIAVIHRGFSAYGETKFRNIPRWQIPIELKWRYPDLTVICDNSHICGRRDILSEVAQESLDLNFDGLMTEIHPNPDKAWSDAKQQITPDAFRDLVAGLKFRKVRTDDVAIIANLNGMRERIDHIDSELLQLLGQRMEVVQEIGTYKKDNDISILQPTRWDEIVNRAVERGAQSGLSREFINIYLKAVHQESINHQDKIMNT